MLVCAVTMCLLAASAMAQQPQCETNIDSARLMRILQASPTDACRYQMLALVAVQDAIEEAAVVYQALAVVCEPVCLEYVRMFAEECLPSNVSVLRLACGKNEQTAQFCYQTVAQNNGTLLLDQCYPQGNRPYLPATMCSRACRNAVEDF